MNAVLLITMIFGVTIQQVAQKAYNKRVTGGVYSFSAASAWMAVLVFIATSGGKFDFSADFLIYSVAFAAAYCTSTVTLFLAISTGPLSLTSLVMQYSLVIPTLYGLVMLDEPIKLTLVIGIILLLVSLIFINLEGKGEGKKITLKWGIYALLAFVSNGFCSVIQKVQQINMNGLYKNEFMILSLIITIAALLIFAFCAEKRQVFANIKKGFVWYTICGIANGVVNFLALMLALKMPASVMFPIVSAGGIVLTALIAVFFYKEKLSPQQYIGITLGALAIIALNL